MVATKYNLEDVLTEKQLHHVVKKYVTEDQWELVDSTIKSATEGLAGFLGDHLKVVLHVKAGGWMNTINLFVKKIPAGNQPKADFIHGGKFYTREMIMFQLIEEMCPEEGPNPFCPKALVCTESKLVLRDLNVEGYSHRSHKETFDLSHELVAAASVARFHAAFARLHTRKNRPGQPYNVLDEYGHILQETTFQPGTTWLRTAVKLTANFLDTFSTKYTHKIPGFESKILMKFEEACCTLKEHEGTLNVVLHKDLWANNIMFKYEKGMPANVLLIDYQCVRYGPPAFDVMMLLYLTTSREFREQHETKIQHYYYYIFWDALDDATKERLRGLGYDREEFMRWCQYSRMMCMCLAIGIFPYVMMEPVLAQSVFDNPETFEQMNDVDRTEPVVRHARECSAYRERQLEVAEEFVERFVMNEGA